MANVNLKNTNSGGGALTFNSVNIFNLIYPVGSIYLSVNNTNPQTLFGGTWTQIKDKFILAAGDVYRNGDTGGSDTHNHSLNDGYAKITRTFAGDSLYSNEKTVSEYWLSSNGRTYPVNSESYAGNCNKGVTLGGTTENVSNMPPYLVAYVWKRTA